MTLLEKYLYLMSKYTEEENNKRSESSGSEINRIEKKDIEESSSGYEKRMNVKEFNKERKKMAVKKK